VYFKELKRCTNTQKAMVCAFLNERIAADRGGLKDLNAVVLEIRGDDFPFAGEGQTRDPVELSRSVPFGPQ
jgi:hypothetical protein